MLAGYWKRLICDCLVLIKGFFLKVNSQDELILKFWCLVYNCNFLSAKQLPNHSAVGNYYT